MLVTPDLSYRYWTVVAGQFIFCVCIPLVICVCVGSVFGLFSWYFLDVLGLLVSFSLVASLHGVLPVK